MRLAALIALTACLALTSGLQAAPTVQVSWGKVGISLEQYRHDAVQCGRAGYYRDVSHTEAAQVFKNASRQLEANENSGADVGTFIASARIVEGTRPEMQIAQVRAYLQEATDRCLTELGYSRFRLTGAQQRQLRRLHLGSPERHAYLYSLASDPAVLRSQAV